MKPLINTLTKLAGILGVAATCLLATAPQARAQSGAPIITSSSITSGMVGLPFNFSIIATNSPTAFAISGSLPPGLNLNGSTGVISGTPAVSGSPFHVTTLAMNTSGTGSAYLDFFISPAGSNPPVNPFYAAMELKAQLEAHGSATITITGTIDLTLVGGATVASTYDNTTGTGKTILGADANSTIIGGLTIPPTADTLAITGITFTGGTLAINGAPNLNLSFCTFIDTPVVITNDAPYAVIAANKFTATPAGTGSALRITGTGASNGNDTAIWLSANLFGYGLRADMPAVTNATVIMANNLITATGNTTATLAAAGAQILSLYNIYQNTNNPLTQQAGGLIRAIGNTHTATTGTTAPGADTVIVLDRSWSLYPADATLANLITTYMGNTAGQNSPDAVPDNDNGYYYYTDITANGATLTAIPGAYTSTGYVPNNYTPASIQWYLNYAPIPGATTLTHTATTTGAYTAALTTPAGEIVFSTAYPMTVDNSGTTTGTTGTTTGPTLTANVTAIAAGGAHSLFVTTGGTLYAMGESTFGQLGNAIGDGNEFNTTCEPLPVPVATNVAAVFAGNNHTLYITTDAKLYATGLNDNGQLGNGKSGDGAYENTPVQIATNIATAAAGYTHSLYVTTDGKLYAMGENACGELGDGTTTQRPTPVPITTPAPVKTVAAGYNRSYFLTTDGALWTMGDNTYGATLTGTATGYNTTPVQIATNVATISAGDDHCLYLTTNGALWAIGDNTYGELGDNTTTDHLTPVQITTNVSAIAAGGSHSLYLTTDGKLHAMGYNATGQLGNATTTDSHTPVLIDTNVATIAAGANHSLYTKTDGSLYAMGDNSCGQLGNGAAYGTNDYQPTPILIVQGTGAAPAPAAPIITTQPLSQTITAGATATITVTATSSTPLTYQWQKNGAPIPGATNATLTIPNAQPTDTATYTVLVTNPTGTTTSAPATLTVNPATPPNTNPPTITSPPNADAKLNTPFTYQITATNTPAAYTLAGALPPGLTLNTTTGLITGTPTTPGAYTITLTTKNQYGTSAPLTLTILIAPDDPPTYTITPLPDTSTPTVMLYGPDGTIYISDPDNNCIMRITPAGLITHAFIPNLNNPAGLALDPAGANLYIADTGNNAIKLAPLPAGTPLTTIATNLNAPKGIAIASNGTIYVSCAGDNTIYMLTPNPAPGAAAAVSSSEFLAPSLQAAGTDDTTNNDTPAADTNGATAPTLNSERRTLNFPAAAAAAPTRNEELETRNSDAAPAPAATTYTPTLLAGSPNTPGSADGAGSAARFDMPTALALDPTGKNLYVADTGNSTLRKIEIATRTVTTAAGAPGQATLADGPGTAARLNTPESLAIDKAGLVYIADTGNNLIRVYDPITEKVTSIIPAPDAAPLDTPAGIAVNTYGDGTVSVASAATPTTAPALFALAMKPTIITKPANLTKSEGQRVTLDATAYASPAPSYEWRDDNTHTTVATTPIYELPAAKLTDTGTYTVLVTNAAGADTATFTLTITSTTTVAPPNTGGGGGGGGGAPSLLWLTALVALLGARAMGNATPGLSSQAGSMRMETPSSNTAQNQ